MLIDLDMKKTTAKARQLELVRNVVRQLTASDLQNVAGGMGCTASCTGTCHAPSQAGCAGPTKFGCDGASLGMGG